MVTPKNHHPQSMTAAERLTEIAQFLAVGIIRLGTSPAAGQKSEGCARKRLAEASHVTAQCGHTAQSPQSEHAT